MANPEHLEILKQGVERWNKWRDEHSEVMPDLRGADLSNPQLGGANLRTANLRGANVEAADLDAAQLGGADLSEADLSGANLFDAVLTAADLWGSDLIDADLCRVDLSQAKLHHADLTDADLTEADLDHADLLEGVLRGTNFSRANLSWAQFRGADLRGADFSGAGALATIFGDVDLAETEGLETVFHAGPSTVGIDTIYKSRGKIPEPFLRGCGVPEEFIDFVRQMGLRPIEFYSCFISYSTKDQEFAERLHADLQAKGVRCWFAPEEMKGGRKLHEQIDDAIRLHDRLLLILSKDSMSSEWVKTEARKARQREVKEGKRVLFPIRLVDFEMLRDWVYLDIDGKNLAEEIREYFIPDFSNWKDHDSYQTAFQRLVKDLKSSG